METPIKEDTIMYLERALEAQKKKIECQREALAKMNVVYGMYVRQAKLSDALGFLWAVILNKLGIIK